MMQLYLIRHTESEANIDRSVCKNISDRDVDLSMAGYSQLGSVCENLMHKLGQKSLTAIYSSPFKRTSILAKKIKSAFPSSKISYSEELSEINYGHIKGLDDQEWLSLYPENRIAYLSTKKTSENQDRILFQYPGGESLRDVFKRTALFLQSLLEIQNPDSQIVIVSHDVTIRSILNHCDEMPGARFFEQKKVENGEIKIRNWGMLDE